MIAPHIRFSGKSNPQALCCEIRGRMAANTGSLLTHFICLALSLLPMKRMERHCIITRAERPVSRPISRSASRFLPVFPRLYAQKHSGGVASMTRDRGYPDWLVLSARLLRSGYHSAKYIYICFGCVWLVAMCRYYSLLLYVVIFVTFPPWSSQMTIILITNAMYHIRYKNSEYEFKRKNPHGLITAKHQHHQPKMENPPSIREETISHS